MDNLWKQLLLQADVEMGAPIPPVEGSKFRHLDRVMICENELHPETVGAFGTVVGVRDEFVAISLDRRDLGKLFIVIEQDYVALVERK